MSCHDLTVYLQWGDMRPYCLRVASCLFNCVELSWPKFLVVMNYHDLSIYFQWVIMNCLFTCCELLWPLYSLTVSCHDLSVYLGWVIITCMFTWGWVVRTCLFTWGLVVMTCLFTEYVLSWTVCLLMGSIYDLAYRELSWTFSCLFFYHLQLSSSSCQDMSVYLQWVVMTCLFTWGELSWHVCLLSICCHDLTVC